ncbi:MAG: L-threonylcarbamoyladenylate synthase [Candidatus Saccharimonadales bacterium]
MTTAEQLLQAGVVAVIPTDTVYGVVARASDQVAVKRLYELKNRASKPGTIIAASIEQLEQLGLKHRYLKAVEQFWPGKVSIVIPTSNPELAYLYQDKHSLAVRVTADRKLLDILTITGPLLTSSANQPGQPPAENISQAKAYFGNEVDFYIDGGDLSGHAPSTIISIVDDAIQVLRPGAVKIDDATIEP